MIKVLWIVNIIFPEVKSMLNNSDSFKSSGGWLLASASKVIDTGDVDLSIINVSNQVKKLTILKGEHIVYYIIPSQKQYRNYFSDMKKVNELAAPDVVHIHGTEFPYGRAWIEACPVDNVIVSIQGLISVIARYYRSGLSKYEIVRNITFRDMMRRTVLGDQRDFYKRGKDEIEVIKKVKHIIGRTEFDHAHCLALNPLVNYHFCNETLRKELYEGRWNYDECNRHTIFLSQANYPIKGLHIVIKALPLIKQIYPDVCLRVAGSNITNVKTWELRLRQGGYGKYVRRLIQDNHLEKQIVFTGSLNAEEMKCEYLKANLFICPSSIENSSNSLCEAQLLGVPCLASYVGGSPDLIPNKNCGDLYRYDDVEMMAFKVCQIFEKSSCFDNTEMIKMARERHNPEENNQKLLSIYRSICNC